MEALVAQAIKDTTSLRKTSVSWKADEPVPQSYYAFDLQTSSWNANSPSTHGAPSAKSSEVTSIAVYSWNIDFMLPFDEARMKPALAHLHDLINAKSSPTTAPVVFLQECKPDDLKTIAMTPWVRDHFYLTDIDHTNWATKHYGTTILIDSRLSVVSVFRVHYSKTRMDRDALFVDVLLGSDDKKIRLCNTHLESMAFEPPFRPFQMQVVARYLHEDSLHAGLVAGDFNAIQPFDRTLHVDHHNGLKDAFLELGGEEDTEEGFTWGQQAATKLRDQFGCSRMDKVYFCGRVKLTRFERFGQDVFVDGEEERRAIVELGFEKPWVTDHLGVMAELEAQPLLEKAQI